MAGRPKRKTTVMLDADALDCAKDLQIDVSAVAEARHKKWVEENTDAFAAQADWHERNGHPLAEIIAAPGGDSLKI
jgi:antitoxin CcdA